MLGQKFFPSIVVSYSLRSFWISFWRFLLISLESCLLPVLRHYLRLSLWRSHRLFCHWPALGQRWPMTLILPGRCWFSAGQGWDWNSRNSSAGPLSGVSSFFQAYRVYKIQHQPIEITQGLFFLNILESNLVFLMFHFFNLKLDWNPKNLEGKCSN